MDIYPYRMTRKDMIVISLFVLGIFFNICRLEFSELKESGFDLASLGSDLFGLSLWLIWVGFCVYVWFRTKDIKITVDDESLIIFDRKEFKFEWNELPYAYFVNTLNQVRVVLAKRELSANIVNSILFRRDFFSPIKRDAVVICFNTGGQSNFLGDTIVRFIGERYEIEFPLVRNRIVSGTLNEDII